MLLEEDDQGSSRGLLAAFAWCAPELARLRSPEELYASVIQVLCWEGLTAAVWVCSAGSLHLAAGPQVGREKLGCTRVDARATSSVCHVEEPLASAWRAAMASALLPRVERWDGTPATVRWCAAPILNEGEVRAYLIVEGARLGPASARVIGEFAAMMSSVLARQREVNVLREAIDRHQQHQRLVAAERLTVLGEAATVLAHEMRNPLGSISNAVALLERGGNPGAEPLGIIREEVGRLDALVHDLLQLARPLEPNRQRVELLQLAHSTLARMQRSGDATTVRYTVTSHEQPHVSADRALLGLALENLLRNAAQASPMGAEVRLTISGDAASALISVEDDGPGVAPSDHARIFEPFFTTRAVGTGLGLPIVKRLIEAHGGTVRLDSTAARGARFELSLPRI